MYIPLYIYIYIYTYSETLLDLGRVQFLLDPFVRFPEDLNLLLVAYMTSMFARVMYRLVLFDT